jgi:hypothetical protein
LVTRAHFAVLGVAVCVGQAALHTLNTSTTRHTAMHTPLLQYWPDVQFLEHTSHEPGADPGAGLMVSRQNANGPNDVKQETELAHGGLLDEGAGAGAGAGAGLGVGSAAAGGGEGVSAAGGGAGVLSTGVLPGGRPACACTNVHSTRGATNNAEMKRIVEVYKCISRR